MSWAEDQTIVPAKRRTQPDLRKLVAALALVPGRWFELDTYPAEKVGNARSRGSQITKRYPGTDYAVLPVADSDTADTVAYVLYLRATP